MAAISSAIAAVSAVAGGAMAAKAQSKAAKQSANAVGQAAAQNNATDLAIYNDQRDLLEPNILAGAQAKARKMLMEGIPASEVRAYLERTTGAVGAPGAAGNNAPDAELQARYPSLYRDFTGGDTVYGTRYGNFGDYLRASGQDTSSQAPPTTGTPGSSPDTAWVDNWSWQPNSPSYAFRVGEGTKALERSAAAKGRLFSGATGMALERYGQDMGAQEFEADYRRLGGLAGEGADAAGTVVNVAGQYGDNVTGNNTTAANARASAYGQQGAANSEFWGNTVPGAIGVGVGYGSKRGWF